MRRVTLYAVVLAGTVLFAGRAHAGTTLNIWPEAAPGSEHWTWHEQVFHDVKSRGRDLGTVYEDVVTPTLTLYLPAKDKAMGAGVIVAPGGGCMALAMKPAEDTARWLAQKGIAAFVLKYRLQRKLKPGPLPANLNEDVACRWGIADGVQALKVVRSHASQWDVSPDRIGIMGFSAGGMIAAEVLARKDPAGRPDFAGLIYGAPFASMPAIPTKLPPVFMAWAQDDEIAGTAMNRFYSALETAGYQPEAHIYFAGGHGFAASGAGATSKHWLQEFYWWLQAHGFTKPDQGKPR